MDFHTFEVDSLLDDSFLHRDGLSVVVLASLRHHPCGEYSPHLSPFDVACTVLLILGLIISNYSDTMQQAIFVMWFFMVILLLLSGLFTPTRSMPPFAYLSTYINPVSYFIEAMRTVFIRGGNISSIAHQLLALSGIGLFMGTWAVVSYKKNKR